MKPKVNKGNHGLFLPIPILKYNVITLYADMTTDNNIIMIKNPCIHKGIRPIGSIEFKFKVNGRQSSVKQSNSDSIIVYYNMVSYLVGRKPNKKCIQNGGGLYTVVIRRNVKIPKAKIHYYTEQEGRK